MNVEVVEISSTAKLPPMRLHEYSGDMEPGQALAAYRKTTGQDPAPVVYRLTRNIPIGGKTMISLFVGQNA
jgi:hypothetical protein